MATNRATPEWGKAIFSDLCVILRPQVITAVWRRLFTSLHVVLGIWSVTSRLQLLGPPCGVCCVRSRDTKVLKETVSRCDENLSTRTTCLLQGPEDVSNFLKYAIALTRVHLQLSKLITPVTQNRCWQRLREDQALPTHAASSPSADGFAPVYGLS